MSNLMTGILGENFPKVFFEQLDYFKCFALKNSFLERIYLEGE